MLDALTGILTPLQTSALGLVPFIGGFGLFAGGGVLALGNHQKGKEAVICALIGIAVMLASFTMAKAIHA